MESVKPLVQVRVSPLMHRIEIRSGAEKDETAKKEKKPTNALFGEEEQDLFSAADDFLGISVHLFFFFFLVLCSF